MFEVGTAVGDGGGDCGGEVEEGGEDEGDDGFEENFVVGCLGEIFGGDESLGQHGPIQLGKLCLSFDVLKPEHFMWSHLKQDVHWTLVVESFLIHMAHFQTTGPGLGSIPARIS